MERNIVALFLAILLVLACVGCGKTETKTTDTPESEVVETPMEDSVETISEPETEPEPEPELETDPFPKDTQCDVCGGWVNEIDLSNGNTGDGWKLYCPHCYKETFMGSMLPGGDPVKFEDDPTIVDILGMTIEEFNEYKAEHKDDYAEEYEDDSEYSYNWSGQMPEGAIGMLPDTEVIVVDPSWFE